MKEIGGYFGLENLINDEYHKNAIALNTARNALIYLIKAKKIEKIYLPYYLCDSVSSILTRNNYKFEYYRVDGNFKPIFEKDLDLNEYLYIVNYYGQIDNEEIKNLKNQYENIIFDNTHSFYQLPVENIDTIYSCRKFFGVPDGAYLYTDKKINIDLLQDKSKDKMKHILGRFEGVASDYYNDFKSNDESFKQENLKLMSKLTHNILGAIDYKTVAKKRNENFKYLHKKLESKNKLKLNIPEVPFMYPLYMENAKEIKLKLAKKKIYIPTLWPNVFDLLDENTVEYKYVENILPIPCDQRYSIEDMEYIIEQINIEGDN